MRKILTFFLKISISFVLLIFLFSRIDFRSTLSYISQAGKLYLGIATFLFVAIHLLSFIRWKIFLMGIDSSIPSRKIEVSFLGSLFFNLFLPSSIGGDSLRVADLSSYTKDSSFVLATVMLDRISGFLGLVLVALIACLYGFSRGVISDLALFGSVFFLGLISILSFCFVLSKGLPVFFIKLIKSHKIREYLFRFQDACFKLRLQKKILLNSLFLSLLIQCGLSVLCYFIGLSLGIQVSILYYFIFIPLISVISVIPISIGGLGIRDNAAVFLFSALGVGEEKIVAMTLILFALLFLFGIIGGGIYGFALYSRRLQYNK